MDFYVCKPVYSFLAQCNENPFIATIYNIFNIFGKTKKPLLCLEQFALSNNPIVIKNTSKAAVYNKNRMEDCIEKTALVIHDWWSRLLPFRTILERQQSLEHVCCGGDLFPCNRYGSYVFLATQRSLAMSHLWNAHHGSGIF